MSQETAGLLPVVPFVENPDGAEPHLEGGGPVKGNLIDCEPDPEKPPFGMPVEVVYEKAPPKDGEGNEYVTCYFQPRG